MGAARLDGIGGENLRAEFAHGEVREKLSKNEKRPREEAGGAEVKSLMTMDSPSLDYAANLRLIKRVGLVTGRIFTTSSIRNCL